MDQLAAGLRQVVVVQCRFALVAQTFQIREVAFVLFQMLQNRVAGSFCFIVAFEIRACVIRGGEFLFERDHNGVVVVVEIFKLRFRNKVLYPIEIGAEQFAVYPIFFAVDGMLQFFFLLAYFFRRLIPMLSNEFQKVGFSGSEGVFLFFDDKIPIHQLMEIVTVNGPAFVMLVRREVKIFCGTVLADDRRSDLFRDQMLKFFEDPKEFVCSAVFQPYVGLSAGTVYDFFRGLRRDPFHRF